MKFKSLSLFVVLVLFLTLLVCDNGNSQGEKEEFQKFEIKYAKGAEDYETKVPGALKSLEGQIGDDHAALAQHFLNNEFMEMAKIMGDRTFIVKDNYDTITGKWKIAEYFKEEKKRKKVGVEQHVEIEFTTSLVYISNRIPPVKGKVCYEDESGMVERNFDSYSLELFSFRIKVVENGKTIQNQRGEGGTGRCHQDDCTWGRCR